MSLGLSILLVIFSALWFIAIIIAIYTGKISVRYSIVWFFAALMLLVVGLFPGLMEWVAGIFHFELVSNLVAGVLITLLMIITFVLTLFVTKQKKQINSLIQEVSILRSKLEKDDKRK
ncbi:DUF2304 domain-containing protein [Candidatus Saccharibacteria bacterium]|nr:DUF2304 domain-containing protein [Candidatus Saccharibacteria bacterium]